jgi:hypothetical protein
VKKLSAGMLPPFPLLPILSSITAPREVPERRSGAFRLNLTLVQNQLAGLKENAWHPIQSSVVRSMITGSK